MSQMLAVADDDVPGGKGYLDVTSVLAGYASGRVPSGQNARALTRPVEIAPGAMLAMKNFTLHDAMMAIEVNTPFYLL